MVRWQCSHSESKKIKNNIFPGSRLLFVNELLLSRKKLKSGIVSAGAWAETFIKNINENIIVLHIDLIVHEEHQEDADIITIKKLFIKT